MMKLLKPLTFILTLLLASQVSAEILVVVNSANPIQQVSQRELVDMYMGRNVHFADGSLAVRLDQQPDSADRQQFYQKLVNKSVAQVNAYWARLLFTGRTRPPKTVNSAAALLATVKDNPQAIGYIDASQFNQQEGVKVVGKLQ